MEPPPEPIREFYDGWEKVAFGCVPLLTDVYVEDDCYVWWTLEHEDHDLQLQDACEGSIGLEPDWVIHEDGGYLEILDTAPEHVSVTHDGYTFSSNWIDWAIQNGIAPGQPFCIRFGKPNYYQCGGYEYPSEWDVEYDWEIMYVEPWEPERVRKAWEEVLLVNQKWRVESALQRREHERRRALAVGAMAIKWQVYCTSGDGWANGISCELVSYYIRGQHILASGRSDKGEHDEAFAKLVETCSKRFPHIDEKTLLAIRNHEPLPGLRIWDRLPAVVYSEAP